MAIFANKQVAQMYVATAVNNAAYVLPYYNTTTGKDSVDGEITIKKAASGRVFVLQQGKGGVVKSDGIENLMYAKATPAKAEKLQAFKVVLGTDITAAANDEIVLRLTLNGLIDGAEDSSYIKDAVVKATGTAATDAVAIAKAIAGSFDREAWTSMKMIPGSAAAQPALKKVNDIFEIGVAKSAGTTLTCYTCDGTEYTKTVTTSLAANTIVIVEKEQPWIKGTANDSWLSGFEFNVINVTNDFETVKATAFTDASLVSVAKAAHKVADMEYFYMGNRGDQYRLKCWPDYVPTQYYLDGTKACDIITLHFAYIGDNGDVQKSEKDIILAFPVNSITGSLGTEATKAKNRLNQLFGAGTIA